MLPCCISVFIEQLLESLSKCSYSTTIQKSLVRWLCCLSPPRACVRVNMCVCVVCVWVCFDGLRMSRLQKVAGIWRSDKIWICQIAKFPTPQIIQPPKTPPGWGCFWKSTQAGWSPSMGAYFFWLPPWAKFVLFCVLGRGRNKPRAQQTTIIDALTFDTHEKGVCGPKGCYHPSIILSLARNSQMMPTNCSISTS